MSNVYEARFSTMPKASAFDKFCKKLLFRQLASLKHEQLKIIDDGEVHTFGNTDSNEIHAEIYVQQRSAYRQVLLGGSVGAGEAYMAGGWTTPDLTAVVRFFVRNMETLDNMDTSFNFLQRLLEKINHHLNANTIRGAQKNISAHYDLNNDFFRLFLDRNMMYSSAIFRSPDETLDQASINKLAAVCEKLQLQSDDHLLEIGSGWGGLAIFAARHYGCKVTTTTISQEQFEFAQQRISDEGLEDKVTILLEDYRKLDGQFDKLVSIEMIEAVGHDYLEDYFTTCSNLLKPNGLMLLQAITIPDQRYDYYCREIDFIKKYIFPGGHLPSLHIIFENTAKHTDFQLVDLQDIGFDYARTINHWHQRFKSCRDELKVLGFDESFMRMWEYYFSYCEGGFMEQSISTSQILFSKPQGKKIFA